MTMVSESRKLKDRISDIFSQINSSPSIGIIYATLSTFFFSYNYFAAQEVIRLHADFPVFEIVLIRSFVQLICVTPYIYIRKETIFFEKDKWSTLSQIVIVQYAITLLGYITLNFIPTSLMLPISATCPLFAILFSVLILKDTCFLLDAICGVVAIIGVLFISRPSFIFGKIANKTNQNIVGNLVFENPELNSTVGCILAIAFGAMKGLFFALVKKWTCTTSAKAPLVFYTNLLGVCITPLVMSLRGHVFELTNSVYETYSLIAASLASLLGLIASILAVKTQPPTVVGLIRNLDIFWGFLLQVAFLRVWPSSWSLVGSFLIIMTTVIICFRGRLLEKLSCYKKEEGYSKLERQNDE